MSTNNNTRNAAQFSAIHADAEGERFATILDATLFALDAECVGFKKHSPKGSRARAYATALTEGEVVAVMLNQSEEFARLERYEPDAAEIILRACEFGVRLFAGDRVADVAPPRWANTEALFLDAIDLEGNYNRTHTEWVKWFLDVAELNPDRQAVQDALQGVLDALYEGGVVHGRFYIQNSLAWSAWSGIGFPLVGLAQFPHGLQQVVEGATVMAALIRIHAGDASGGIGTKSAGELLDVVDAESGKLASSFVSMTSGPGSEKQRAPFPEDFQVLFHMDVEKDAKRQRQFAADRATLVGYEQAETEGTLVTGVKFVEDALAKALAALK